MKALIGIVLISAVLVAVFYLYVTLTPKTGAPYAQANNGSSEVVNPTAPQIPQDQGR